MTASRFVVISSPGMHDTAASVVSMLRKKHNCIFPHYRVEHTRFANGEVVMQIPETVRRQHAFFFHPLQLPSPSDAIITMLLTNDALKRASVSGITLVLPYMSYLRQDRKDKPRVPISARMLADLIESNRYVSRIITADMHADQEQGFFSLPVDNLMCSKIFAEYVVKTLACDVSDVVAIAADLGGAVRTRRFARGLGEVQVAIFEKRRTGPNQSEVVSIIGPSVEGKIVVIFEDMIDTGGTIRGVVASLKQLGAREVFVCATHGIFSGGTEEKFASENVRVFCTNSIPRDESYYTRHASWLTCVPIDELFADAVYQASLVGGSVSKLTT